ncbi:hypothetical protein CMV_030318, partial [Castanea mollissima]
ATAAAPGHHGDSFRRPRWRRLDFPSSGSMERKIMHMWLRKFVFCNLY